MLYVSFPSFGLSFFFLLFFFLSLSLFLSLTLSLSLFFCHVLFLSRFVSVPVFLSLSLSLSPSHCLSLSLSVSLSLCLFVSLSLSLNLSRTADLIAQARKLSVIPQKGPDAWILCNEARLRVCRCRYMHVTFAPNKDFQGQGVKWHFYEGWIDMSHQSEKLPGGFAAAQEGCESRPTGAS